MKNKVKEKVRIRLGPVSKSVLAVVAVGIAVPFFAVFPGVALIIAPFIKKNKKKIPSKQLVQKNIDSLVVKGLLKRTFDIEGNVVLSLTKRGGWEYGIRNGKELDVSEKKHWDGRWRIVIFDIPENKRAVRRELRRAVSLYGFIKLQQSVWLYPYPCDDFVELIRTYLEIKSDVLYITTDHIDMDKKLRKEFHL